MELIFLGTGAGVPSKSRNVSSIALSLLQELNSIWLFDCGEATQHQILHTSIKPGKIDKIFITHLHGDHIFGLPGLLSSRSFQGGESKLTLFGPKGLQEFVETSISISASHLTYPIEFIEVCDGKVYEDEKFLIYAKKLDHGIPSYGYRVVEKDKQGSLLAEKLQAYGIEPGPIYQQIKENEKVVLDDGRTIYRKDVVGPMKKGRIITIFGDTRYKEEFIPFAMESDVIIHEATFADDKAALAAKYFHSTTVQAASIAKKANAKNLILTHISSRYQNEEEAMLLEEAKGIFPNTVIAHDFYRQTIE